MQFPLTVRPHESAALAFDDIASGLDAGLTPVMLGADTDQGERVLQDLLSRRGVQLTAIEEQVLAAGWRAGRPGPALRSLARQRRQSADLLRTLRQRMAYPLAVTAMAIVAAAISGLAIGNTSVLITTLAVAALLALALALGCRGIANNHPLLLRIPIIGSWLRDRAELPYLQVLHGLYATGVTLREAHAAACASYPLADGQRALRQADQLLQAGQPLAAVWAQAPVLSGETVQLLTSGEQAGELEQALARALERRSARAQAQASQLIGMLGTAVYVAAAGLAIFVIFSFYASYLALAFR